MPLAVDVLLIKGFHSSFILPFNNNNPIMTTNINEEKIRIAREILLSSPPGQFQETVSNLKCMIDIDPHSTQLLTRGFIQEVQSVYDSTKGREILGNEDSASGGIQDDDEFGKKLNQSFHNYVQNFYSSKGVESNYTINTSSSDGENDNCNRYNVILYAERIKLPQYHAGSWFAKYTIDRKSNDGGVVLNGVVEIHAHTFESGNVQLKSKVEFPSSAIEESASLADDIVAQIQKWDEEHVVSPLKNVYNDMSADILKKMRRVMPVTRTKFNWNVEGHRFVKTMEGHNVRMS